MTLNAVSNTFQKALPDVQKIIVRFALVGFFASLLIYFATQQGWLVMPERFTPSTFLTCLTVPLSILLIYELLLLVKATTGSFIVFVMIQFEVISLILLRDLFKRIDELQQSGFALSVVGDIAVVAFGTIILYFMIEVLERISKHFVAGKLKEELPGKEGIQMARFKTFLELALLAFLTITVVYEVVGYAIGKAGTGLDSHFVEIIFSGLIVYSITQLLLVLIINDKYETLFEHSAMVLASVVVLASLDAPTYVRIPLIIGSLGFIIVTLFLHGFARGKSMSAMMANIKSR